MVRRPYSASFKHRFIVYASKSYKCYDTLWTFIKWHLMIYYEKQQKDIPRNPCINHPIYTKHFLYFMFLVLYKGCFIFCYLLCLLHYFSVMWVTFMVFCVYGPVHCLLCIAIATVYYYLALFYGCRQFTMYSDLSFVFYATCIILVLSVHFKVESFFFSSSRFVY